MKFDTKGRTDFEAIRRSVDLKRFIQDDLGPPMKGGRWACPIHGGDGPNFSVKGDRWHCFKCGESGDVFDYLMKVEHISIIDAAAKLDPSSAFRREWPRRAARPATVRTEAPETRRPAWEDKDWQVFVDQLVRKAKETLWSPAGRAALDWLRARGLDDATIRRFHLGFLPGPVRSEPFAVLGPDRHGKARCVWAGRGVLIPWAHPFVAWHGLGVFWAGANVRNLPPGDPSAPPSGSKYTALGGSERGHGYPFPECPAPGEPAIVCEGEFDALVAWQEAGWVANVVTFGGAGQKKETDDGRAFLAACPDWLLMFDQDDAGDDAARTVARRAPHRCRRLYLPAGVNDLTDLHKSGGSVLGWLRSEWERFGWPWPLRS